MARGEFRLEDVAGIRVVRCAALEALPGLAHAFSTRIGGGGSGFDLGGAGAAPPDVLARREAFLAAAGLPGKAPSILTQVHGTDLVENGGGGEADGGIAAGPQALAPAVRSADCVPVLLADLDGRAVASVHAGWRGTAAGIARRAVERLAAAGVTAERLVVALGPAVGPCCYEVGPEVELALGPHARRAAGGRATADLHGANAAQLAAAGVPARAIHRAPWCTRCRNDLFFSVRAEGPRAGRLMAVIGRTGQS